MKKLHLAVALATALTMGTAAGAVASTTITVTGDTSAGENEPGWLFQRDLNNVTDGHFTLDEASIGSGSFYVEPLPGAADPTAKFIAEFFILEELEADTSYSFDFLLGDEAADSSDFYLNVYTNLPGTDVDNFYDCAYDFGGVTGSTSEWSTISTDTDQLRVRARNEADCPDTFQDMAALDGSTVRAIAINVGQSTASDEGTSGYVDNVVVTSAGTTTVYDFEVPLTVKDDCKNGGYANFGFDNQGECIASLQADDNAGK